jgi:hypothetical protein
VLVTYPSSSSYFLGCFSGTLSSFLAPCHDFTVRVELHGAENESETYAALHKAMGKRKFHRSIRQNESTYELPPAEYHRSGDGLTGEDVLEDGKAAAKELWGKFAVLVTVTESPKLHWGLKKIK